MDSLEMPRDSFIVDILGELVCCSILFAIEFHEVERADRVALIGIIFSINYRIMIIDFHCTMIVRD